MTTLGLQWWLSPVHLPCCSLQMQALCESFSPSDRPQTLRRAIHLGWAMVPRWWGFCLLLEALLHFG